MKSIGIFRMPTLNRSLYLAFFTHIFAHFLFRFARRRVSHRSYASWPGQAVAYKVGQLEILRLRARAEAALTPVGRFDLKVRGSPAMTRSPHDSDCYCLFLDVDISEFPPPFRLLASGLPLAVSQLGRAHAVAARRDGRQVYRRASEMRLTLVIRIVTASHSSSPTMICSACRASVPFRTQPRWHMKKQCLVSTPKAIIQIPPLHI
jgi:hypothetical protein